GAGAEAAASGFIERRALEVGVAPSAVTMRLVRDGRALANSEPIVVLNPATPRRPRTPRATPIDSVTAGIIAQGRYHFHQRSRAALERAIAYFTRAVERDARAAAAWCGLADTWVMIGGRGYAPVAQAIERAAEGADRAIALDDSLSAAHTSRGGVNILRRRWHDAESELRHAIHLDPYNGDA